MDELVGKAIESLKKHGFKAEHAKDLDECRELVMKQVPSGACVGIPGSSSVRAAGLVEALKAAGHEVLDHWDESLSPVEVMKMRKDQLTCDVLITSANAVSAKGELVNMDGFGNRVAPTISGPSKVVLVVGKNKIVADLDAARERIRKVAAPIRAKELNLKLPCVEKGECTDCASPMRICRIEVILHRPSMFTPTTVIVVDEELGN